MARAERPRTANSKQQTAKTPSTRAEGREQRAEPHRAATISGRTSIAKRAATTDNRHQRTEGAARASTATGKQQTAKIPSRTSFAKLVKKRRPTRGGSRAPSTGGKSPASSVQPPTLAPSRTEAAAGDTSASPKASPIRKPQAEPDDGFVAVGRVGAPMGLKGELKVQVLTDNMARFEPGARLWAGQQLVTVAASREAGGHLFLTLKGFRDRTSVDKFRHALLQVAGERTAATARGGVLPLPAHGPQRGRPRRAGARHARRSDRDGRERRVPRAPTERTGFCSSPRSPTSSSASTSTARRMVVDPPEWR